MSVSLDRAKEVMLAKIKEYLKSEDRLDSYDEEQLNEDNLGQMYDDLTWGDFHEKTGLVHVQSWGGEDEGSSYGHVVSFEVDGETVYLKLTGHYDSWNGVDWDYGSVNLVKPVERTVVFYE